MRLVPVVASFAVLASVSPAAASELRQRGKVLIEGALGFTSTTGEESVEVFGEELTADLPDQSRFIVGAVVGGFLADGFFLGGRLGLDSQSVSFVGNNGPSESSSTSVSFGIVPRYYLALGSSGELFFRLGGLLTYSSVSSEASDAFDESDASANGVAFGFDASLVIAIGQRQGAYFDVGPFITLHRLSDTESDSSVSLTVLGLQVGLGAFL